MKCKIRKLLSQYKTEVRELQKLPDQCKKEVNPVCHGSLMQLKTVILDLEEILSGNTVKSCENCPKLKGENTRVFQKGINQWEHCDSTWAIE